MSSTWFKARQFQKDHEDSHYAAAIFRYQRELAVMFREYSTFHCMDDKHRVQVGEPGYPVAAAERGRRVLVRRDESFEVGDHDFTKFSIVPSVSLSVDIPEDIAGSWYSGQVHIGFKEGVFEPSSPHRHMTELYQMVKDNDKPVMFIYSDGGPDHRLTYLSVQLSIIALYLKLNLDFICAARTAPCHSWRNPAERVMSIVNLGLQCIGPMRQKMPTNLEGVVSSCNNLSELRKAAETMPTLVEAVQESISPVKILLCDIMHRLQLQGQSFQVFSSATEQEMRELWKELETIELFLTFGEKYQKKCLTSFPALVDFLSHCCQSSITLLQ